MKKIFVSLLIMSLVGCATENNVGVEPRMKVMSEPLSIGGIISGATFSLTLVANLVAPPTQDGYNLQANGIYVNGLDTYVSYNYSGPTKKGAVDHVLSTVASAPVLGSEVKLSTSEVNSVFRYGSYILTAGSQDESLGSPGVLQVFPLALGLLNTASDTNKITKPVRSFAGTAVAVKGTSLYVLSGDGSGADGGGLTVFNANTLTEVSQTEIGDARGIWYNPLGTSSANTNTPWVVAGKTSTSNSKLYRLSDAGAIVQTIDLGSSANTIRESKSSVQVGSTMVLVSRGDQGFAIYCAKDGGLLAQQAAITLPGVDPKLTVTNSVTPGPGLVFAANGEAGVYAYSMKDSGSAVGACRGITLGSLGNVNLGTSPVSGVNISANQIYYSGASVLGVTTGTLYVAAGIAGLKIINLTQITTLSDILDF